MAVVVAACLSSSSPATALANQQGKHDSKARKHQTFWDRLAEKYDTNGDKKVTKAEYLAGDLGFGRIDSNHDGVLTMDELEAHPMIEGLDRETNRGFLVDYDLNKDGEVSKAEYDAKIAAFRAWYFDQMDKNKDGAIQPIEVKDVPANTFVL
jgi:EF hand domain-containing protein